MLVRDRMLTWCLLNENDTNEINTDSTRGLVNTHCLCLVLKIESIFFFSNYRKERFRCSHLSKKFQIFPAVHFLYLKLRYKDCLPKLSPKLRTSQLSNLRFLLSFLLPFSSKQQVLAVDLHAHENIWF